MNHPDHLKEYIAGIVLITIILVFATQLDTITGMATSTSGTNTSLSISDDSDTATVYQGELMTFIANYTNLTGTAINNASDNGTCLIQFHDSARAVEMAYNLTTYLYTYSRTLPESGTFSWNVSCVSDLYETLALQETASIADTFCGMVVQGSITLSQDIETAGGATPCSGDGLEIVADDVIIDCAGHTIGGSQSDDGITASGRSNITVINCTIADFARGIYFTSTDESRVYFNTFTGNALHAYSDSADNDFNTTVAGEPWGNSWDDVPRLAIFDSDSDGYGDSGYQYPYNSSHSSKVVGITDWGPVASAVDSDNDGSPDTEDCAPADPTTFAPRDDILVTQDSSLCAGT
ncbi:right-handed parallel beta-helix repeat-containing protein [Candidatus Woesearchaeota archaeon]|nr:right-handed parallel beta-helix repeat-containing protein [Candidatus Woesearchaeota archaeon]